MISDGGETRTSDGGAKESVAQCSNHSAMPIPWKKGI